MSERPALGDSRFSVNFVKLKSTYNGDPSVACHSEEAVRRVPPTAESASEVDTLRRNRAPQEASTAIDWDTGKREMGVYSDPMTILLSTQQGSTSINPADLAQFLARVLPPVEKALREHGAADPFSTALEDLDPGLLSADLILDLQGVPPAKRRADPRMAPLVVTGLSWNSSGYLLAASYGRLDLQGWSDDKGALCCWNIRSADQGPASESASGAACPDPTYFMETDAPLMCCQFHPEVKGLICGGTFSGELLVWDLSEDDPSRRQRHRSEAGDLSHKEPINAVAWVARAASAAGKAANKGKAPEQSFIITASGDSRILVWRADRLAQPLREFKPQIVANMGLTCMALASEDGQVLLGTEGGRAVYFRDQQLTHNILADANLQQAAGAAGGDLRARGELIHEGAVHAVEFSPALRNLYLTCGMDGSLRVASTLGEVLAVEPSARCLYAARWSPHRPALIAAGAGDGRIYFFDLSRDPYQPLKVLAVQSGHASGAAVVEEGADGSEGAAGGPSVTALAFNPSQRDLIACAFGSVVQVWSLGPGLTDMDPRELRALALLSR